MVVYTCLLSPVKHLLLLSPLSDNLATVARGDSGACANDAAWSGLHFEYKKSVCSQSLV